MQATIRNFLKMESSGGIVLMGAAALAMIAANSPAAGLYAIFPPCKSGGIKNARKISHRPDGADLHGVGW